jgi:hypothetical protein
MSLMNIVETLLPRLCGETLTRDCRHVGTHAGESAYEVGFVNTSDPRRAGVRMTLMVHFDDSRLRAEAAARFPGMTYDQEDVAHYLRYRALDILPLLEAYNRRGTDHGRIAEVLFSNTGDIRGRRFGI